MQIIDPSTAEAISGGRITDTPTLFDAPPRGPVPIWQPVFPLDP